MFQTKVADKIKTRKLRSIISFLQKSCRLWDVEKYGRTRQVTYGNIIWLLRFACWRTKAAATHTQNM